MALVKLSEFYLALSEKRIFLVYSYFCSVLFFFTCDIKKCDTGSKDREITDVASRLHMIYLDNTAVTRNCSLQHSLPTINLDTAVN